MSIESFGELERGIKLKKINISNLMYILAIITIPWDNLFFAPSAGWATITPFIFIIYLLINYKYIKKIIILEKELICFLLILLIVSFINYIIYDNFITFNFIDSISTLFLGLIFYFSLVIRYFYKKKDYIKDINLLLISYLISFFYGLTKYISLQLGINSILSVFETIEKRFSYRVSFSFTEPSFISMHVFGIIFIIFLITNNYKIKKRAILIISLFSFISILSFASARFIIDFTLILTIYFFIKLFKKKRSIFIRLFSVFFFVIFMFSVIFFINEHPRINQILESGIYADGSLASRWFRINASLKGYIQKPFEAYFGAGLGNSYQFFNYGYAFAYEEYKSNYMAEVLGLYNTTNNQLFSMPIRIISEFGIFVFLFIIFYLIYLAKKSDVSNKYLILIITFWLYVQFDSYAFYTLWIVLIIFKYNKRRRLS